MTTQEYSGKIFFLQCHSFQHHIRHVCDCQAVDDSSVKYSRQFYFLFLYIIQFTFLHHIRQARMQCNICNLNNKYGKFPINIEARLWNESFKISFCVRIPSRNVLFVIFSFYTKDRYYCPRLDMWRYCLVKYFQTTHNKYLDTFVSLLHYDRWD